ncbi:MAG: S41 family peptidase [Pseudomonas fluorescens]
MGIRTIIHDLKASLCIVLGLTAALASGIGSVNAAPLPLPDAERPLWLRTPSVSPDGSRIAFTHGGQIWVVPATGGEARSLTSDQFYSHHPVWSPDGQRLAFASRRHGNDDVFVMPVAGGAVTRLTHHSTNDVPQAFTPDGQEVLFASNRLGDAKASALDGSKDLNGLFEQLYSVPAQGGRPVMVLPFPALEVAPSADGQRLLYTDRRSSENEWRKHHVSEAARDIWLFDRKAGTHRRLSDFRGEDRNAVWTPQQDAVLWLSERSGSFNVWRQPLAGGSAQQITFHKDHPVRFLSSARDGTLVYGFDGEIWRQPAGATQPQRVPVQIRQGNLMAGPSNVNLAGQATELAVSPTAPEYALIARGEVFVVSALSGVTRRITNTPAEERHLSYAPDGRSLLYASERNGRWEIMEARLNRADDTGFAGATPFTESVLISSEGDAFQPMSSPDGKRIAYRQDRTNLRVFERQTRQSVQVLGKESVYSYTDDDLNFAWAPDGRWLVSRTGFETTAEIELIDANGRAPRRNISRSGFTDSHPMVSADGSAILWLSDRVALHSADSNAAAADVYAGFLTPEAFDAFRATPDERQRMDQLSKRQAAATPAKTTVDSALPTADGIERRTVRLTPLSLSSKFFRLTPDQRTLVVVADDPAGQVVGYAIDTASRSPRVLFTRPPGSAVDIKTDDKVTTLVVLGPQGIDRYDIASGKAQDTVPFHAEMARDAQAEIAAIFDHAWRLTQVKFYDPKLHGVDWVAVGQAHRKFLPYVRHWEELAEVLSEMVGELNASHQGGFFLNASSSGDATASLGVYFDDTWRGEGQKVVDILPGGPADRPGSALRAGATVLAVDGNPINAQTDVHRWLNRKADQPVLLSVRPKQSGTPVEQTVIPVSQEQEIALAYDRWVTQRREQVTRLSGGRLGYIHVPAMDLNGYLKAYSDLFGQHRLTEAVVVDVRYNGGGNLHDQLAAMLTGQHLAALVSRDGVRFIDIPTTRWTKPSILIANAASYSDGSAFPSLYQRQKIGKLVGQRVPGTATAVIWERQLDQRVVYGVPQLGFMGEDGKWFENQEIVPEVVVEADPASVTAGRDPQLERAVQELLQQIGPQKGIQ